MSSAEDIIRGALLEPAASDSDMWQPADLIALSARPPEPPSVGGIFYPGRRHIVSGEFECGKSWLLLAVAADELKAKRGVVWVDADDMGDGAVLERLRQLGVADQDISARFGYVRPSGPLTEAAWEELEVWIAERNARLAVFDAFNPALDLHGLDPAKTPDVERFYRTVIDPFRRSGCAAVALDHLVKNPEASKRYSYGSERKASGAEVHLGLTLVDQFGRGKTGRAKITVHKDRPGFLTRPSPGLFVVESSDAGACIWRISEDASLSDAGEFRPTALMEKVSRYLEIFQPDTRSRSQIAESVVGKAAFVRKAIDMLIAEDYAVEEAGSRGARMVRLIHAFRENGGDE